MRLALPRLRPELAKPLPALAGAATLWPGLPGPAPAGSWTPAYDWTPAQAAACLADFERLSREGGHGAPVQAASLWSTAAFAGDDLSPAERRALAELRGNAPENAPDGTRVAAQRALILAWLQETQILDLRALERRVSEGRAALDALLGEGLGAANNAKSAEADISFAPDGEARAETPLPAWPLVLAAAEVFLPDGGAVAVNDRAMAEALAAFGGEPAAAVDGFCALRLPLWKALGASRPSASLGDRDLTFLLPAGWEALP